MRILLDTHTLLWWLAGDERLSRPAQSCLQASINNIYVSAATAWEIATKHRLGKLPNVTALVEDISSELVAQGFHELPVTVVHGSTRVRYQAPIVIHLTVCSSRNVRLRVCPSSAMIEYLIPTT